MSRETLRKLIANLHDELGSTDRVDAKSQEMLRGLMRDVEGLAGDEPSVASRDEATSQLQTAAVKFETEHPKLSMTIGEIVDMLGKLGI